jgi:hypothetical protein
MACSTERGDAVHRLPAGLQLRRRSFCEPLAVLGEVDGVGRGAEDRDARGLEAHSASFSGVWPPNWTMTPWSVPFCRSTRTISRTSSIVSGSKYSRSEVS